MTAHRSGCPINLSLEIFGDRSVFAELQAAYERVVREEGAKER